MSRTVQWILGVLIAALLVGGPLAYHSISQSQIRNFRVVREGVLYRSGQNKLPGLKRLIHDYGFKTVVTLRDAAFANETPPDFDEEKYCKSQDINYVRIAPKNWGATDGSVPAEEGVRTFRSVMDNPENYPVLVHCFAGIHRTGAYCSMYRMEYEHWSNDRAIKEMKVCGYNNLDDEWDLLGYLEQYQPRWKNSPQMAVSRKQVFHPVKRGKKKK